MDVQMKFGAVTLYLYKMELVLRTLTTNKKLLNGMHVWWEDLTTNYETLNQLVPTNLEQIFKLALRKIVLIFHLLQASQAPVQDIAMKLVFEPLFLSKCKDVHESCLYGRSLDLKEIYSETIIALFVQGLPLCSTIITLFYTISGNFTLANGANL